MFTLLKDLALFGCILAVWNWLKQRVCKTGDTTRNTAETRPAGES